MSCLPGSVTGGGAGAFRVGGMATPAVLNAAIASVQRPVVLPNPLFQWSLRPTAPLKPPGTQIATRAVSEAPAAVEDKKPPVDLPEGPVLQMALDIAVWRTRWFWRLVASFVVRRLGR
jgi:hypothetical protein